MTAAAPSPLGAALADFETTLDPHTATRLATSAMRLALCSFAWVEARAGRRDGPAGAAMLLHLADHLAPVETRP